MAMEPRFAETVNEMRTVSKSTQILLAGFSEDFLARISVGAVRDPNSSLAQDFAPRSLSEKQYSKRYASLVECKDANYSTTKSRLL